ncbi:MAG: acyl carrier protein [Clostridium sp.]|nr:acyl carrier protein [Clostridium sp.]MCM1172131.1 acyl carrier protein [Clostridium sp.]MCM1208772.1 acyl carrier protein [Ruminococcus sp.]
MDKEQINKKLEEVISDVMPDIEDINMTSSITDIYGVNSVSLIRLIVAAESKFDVSFSDYELALSSYDTFGDIAAVIAEKLAQ